MTTNVKRALVYGILSLGIVSIGIWNFWDPFIRPFFSRPLREPRQIGFLERKLSSQEQLQFLDGNFRVISRLRDLPRPVLDALREEGGTRLTMADPGRRFEATDVIYDPSLPRRRLIFGGVAASKVFLHYEQGGFAHMFLLELLRVTPQGEVLGLSRRAFCGPAVDLEGLRREIQIGHCFRGVPQQMK